MWFNRILFLIFQSNYVRKMYFVVACFQKVPGHVVLNRMLEGSLVLSKRASCSHLDSECWTQENLGHHTDTHKHTTRRIVLTRTNWVSVEHIGKVVTRTSIYSLERLSFRLVCIFICMGISVAFCMCAFLHDRYHQYHSNWFSCDAVILGSTMPTPQMGKGLPAIYDSPFYSCQSQSFFFYFRPYKHIV